MNFGIPSQRKVKQEAYPNNAIVTIGVDGGKGKSRQLTLNKRACELLKITDGSRLAFAFSPEGGVAIANTEQPGMDIKDGMRVTKSKPRKVSDKKTYNYIAKLLDLDTSVENLFELQATIEDAGGLEVFDMLPFIEGGLEVDGEIEQASAEKSFASFSTFVEEENVKLGHDPITSDKGSVSGADNSVSAAHSFGANND